MARFTVAPAEAVKQAVCLCHITVINRNLGDCKYIKSAKVLLAL